MADDNAPATPFSEMLGEMLKEAMAHHEARRARFMMRLNQRAEDFVRVSKGEVSSDFAMVASLIDELMNTRLLLDESQEDVRKLEARIEALENPRPPVGPETNTTARF